MPPFIYLFFSSFGLVRGREKTHKGVGVHGDFATNIMYQYIHLYPVAIFSIFLELFSKFALHVIVYFASAGLSSAMSAARCAQMTLPSVIITLRYVFLYPHIGSCLQREITSMLLRTAPSYHCSRRRFTVIYLFLLFLCRYRPSYLPDMLRVFFFLFFAALIW